MDKLFLTVPEAGNILGVGRTKVYELTRCGQLPVIHIGRAVRIHVEDVRQFADRLRKTTRYDECGHGH